MSKNLAILSAMLVLGACSTEGRVIGLTSGGGALPAGSSLALNVSGCQPTQCEDLRTSLAGRLIGAGVAERIVASDRADLTLDVQITNIRAVSGAERVFFGAMAGRNEVASTDTLRDRRGAVLRSFKVESASAAHPFSGESGLSDAYRQFASDTVSALR